IGLAGSINRTTTMALRFSAHCRSRSLEVSGNLTDRRTGSEPPRYILALCKSECETGAMTGCRGNPTARQQQTANGSMWLVKGAPNLMQRLSRLPSAPDVTLPQKAQTVFLASYNTTFKEQIYNRWCCIDLLRPPALPGVA